MPLLLLAAVSDCWQDHVTQARPGAPYYRLSERSGGSSVLPGGESVLMVNGLDGVVRTTSWLRDSWVGRAFHLTVTVTLTSSPPTLTLQRDDVTSAPHRANLTVREVVKL